MPSLGRGLPTRKGKSSSSSGSRRRARGLPLASGGASGTSSAGNSSPTPSSDSPAVVLSSASIRRNSSPTGGTKKKNSNSANSPTIKNDNTPAPPTKKHPQTLQAKLDKADAIKFNGSRSGSTDWTVELILDGKPYAPLTSGILETLNIKREGGDTSSSRPRRKRTETIEPDPNDVQEEEEDSDITPSDRASPAPPVRESSFTKKIKGKDGNFHYCKVCREVGDVVCCDGCPQVYHPQCLPVDSDSFAALDLQHDDDPWYCPDCVEKRKQEGKLKNKKTKKRKASGSPTNEMLSPYRQSRPKRKCSIDATEMIENEMRDGNGSPVAIAVKDEDAYDDEVSALSSPPKTPSKPNRSKSPTSTAKKSTPGILTGSKKKSKNKKQKTSSSSSTRPMSPIRLRAASPTPSKNEAGSSSKKKDKKKKKKKKKKDYGDDNDAGDSDGKDDRKSKKSGKKEGGMLTHMLNNNTGMVKATPAFYFFLNDTRNKIERNLSRKHRYFNRLPKANMERNQLIAKEGIMMWMKLKEGEIQNYIEISMKDFERRIIEWKEEKTIRQMFAVSEEGEPEDETLNEEINRSGNSLMEDERVTYENHQRLYLSTTVGSKPYKPDMEESNNRILLELLQDTRFHPLPMIQPNRSAREYGEMDFDRVTIPYFDINGPVSTCLGDECLGCSRGWTHFCNVLKRRIPAVPRRAKLQPPLSSLVATRIGLGLKDPPLANDEDDAEAEKRNGSSSKIIKNSGGGDVQVFSARDVPSAAQAKALPLYPWEALTAPTERADDIVRFVEEAVCMKIPEPPRPGDDDPETTGGIDDGNSVNKTSPSVPTSILGLNLPSRGRKRRTEDGDDVHDHGDDEDVTVNKCGRCRTIIEGDTGCVPCRRAQLVINMSRGEGIADESSKILQVQTNMLGRIVVRDGEVDTQPGGDEAVSNHILRQRWTPFAILPPSTLTSPFPRFDDHSEDCPDDDNSGEEDEISGDDEEEDNVDEIAEDGSDSMEITSEKDDIDVLNTVSDDTMGSEEESSSVTTGEDDIRARPSKRLRASSRIEALEGNGTANADATKIVDTNERNILIKKFKEEANVFYKKCVSIACTGLLLGLTRRDPLLHFAEPVDAEGYHDIIHEPMDFGKIKKKVFRKKYATLGAFCSDARLLCSNAMVFNPPDSIYYKTAKELNDALTVMHKRAMEWLTTMKDAHAATFNNIFASKPGDNSSDDDVTNSSIDDEKTENTNSSPFLGGDPFVRLRKEWPEAVEMFEDNKWLHKAVETDFMRTKENESAYYGVMAIRRAAMAAAASLAPYTDSGGMFNTVGRRNYHEDEKLRAHISEKVAEAVNPPELKEIPHWREEMIMRVLRKSQARRMEGRMGSMHGCARCDGVKTTDLDTSKAMNAATVRWGRTRKKPNEVPRIHKSRLGLSTGLGSQVTQDRIQKHKSSDIRKGLRKGKVWALVAAANKVNEVAVTARGSRIHGMGLFADQPLQKGDVVAEYVGEYVSPAVTDAREKTYQSERIQDYQFRIDSQLVIDATKRGGHGRYANHNCDPNCATKIIPFEIPSKENSCCDGIKTIRTSKNSILKRVVIVAQRDIEPMEELTYDYQFPLEVNMNERIPCNCNSELCRGFMNWDLPEKGAKNQVFRTQKRGANMRDRIRRLGRPLKGDK